MENLLVIFLFLGLPISSVLLFFLKKDSEVGKKIQKYLIVNAAISLSPLLAGLLGGPIAMWALALFTFPTCIVIEVILIALFFTKTGKKN